jgi:Tol biopolymer transport system component
MITEPQKPLKIFCSYSHRDEEYVNELRTWLRGLERQGFIEWWHDREIVPGWEWEEAIDKNLRTADVILLLVSPDFMASDYVFENEIGKSVERHERGEARVIPIIVRPAYWEWAPFGRLQALPKDANPVTRWADRDEAWLDVVRGIQKVVSELTDQVSSESMTQQQAQTGTNGKIIFAGDNIVRQDLYTRDLYTISADGSTQTNLTSNLVGHQQYPAWSPDGTKIAFVSSHDGGDDEIYVMDADGSNLISLTNNLWQDIRPTWSPDGIKIAFQGYRDGSPYSGIFVVDSNGASAPVRITNSGTEDKSPAWSPDGNKIAFSRSNDIYTVRPDGTAQTNLTNSPSSAATKLDPAWSPDGTKIAFWGQATDSAEIYTMNADGSNRTLLTNNSAYDAYPAWSPDGTKIVFVSDRDSNDESSVGELYVMDADGSNQTRLTHNQSWAYWPDW